MPPNSATCEFGTSSSATARSSMRGYYSATSYHPGGINILRADASMFFVTDTIDCGNQNYTGDTEPEGSSPFGVWGALGSIDGGESGSI